MSGWTDEELARLRQLWDQSDPRLSAAQIGVALGKTKNSVVGMARRQGLDARISPIKRPDRPDGARPRARISKHGAKTLPPVAVDVPAAAPPAPPAPRAPAKPCRFLLKTARETGNWPLYCDQPVRPAAEGGGPYCREHAALCYQPGTSYLRRATSLSGVTRSALPVRVERRADDGDPEPLTGEAA